MVTNRYQQFLLLNTTKCINLRYPKPPFYVSAFYRPLSPRKSDLSTSRTPGIINNCNGEKHFALHFLQPKRKRQQQLHGAAPAFPPLPHFRLPGPAHFPPHFPPSPRLSTPAQMAAGQSNCATE